MMENRTKSAAIHNPRSGKTEVLEFADNTDPIETLYSSDGSIIEKVTTKTAQAVAKRVKMESGMLYYLKAGPDGLYDPLGMYSAGSQNLQCQRFGKAVWDYKKVNQFTFDLYIKYLLTKNKTYLTQANREMKN